MPYKSEKIRIEHTKHDRRIKLTDEQRQEIRVNKENLSQRKLAIKYGVSRRLITFILDPNKHEENKKRRAERGGTKIYYDKEKNREVKKEHRKYKQELFLKGEIQLKKTKKYNYENFTKHTRIK